MRTSSQISLDGPFFRIDPAKTFRQNIRLLTRAVADEGAADVRQQMVAGEARRRRLSHGMGRVSNHVVGRVASLQGRPWAVTAVVSVNNSRWSKAQGIALMAGASQVERQTHAFRKMTSRMRRAKALNKVELLKGLK